MSIAETVYLRVYKGLRALCDHQCGHRTWPALLLIERVSGQLQERNPNSGLVPPLLSPLPICPRTLGPSVFKALVDVHRLLNCPPNPLTISDNFKRGDHA